MIPTFHEICDVLTSHRTIGVGFISFGLYLGVQLVRAINKTRNIQNWPQTTGIIKSLSVNGEFISDLFVQAPHVTYRYTVNGQTMMGHKLSIIEINTASRSYAMEKLKGMEAGKEVPVYYNPKKPNEAYLTREVNYAPVVAMVGGLAVILVMTLGVLFLINVI